MDGPDLNGLTQAINPEEEHSCLHLLELKE